MLKFYLIHYFLQHVERSFYGYNGSLKDHQNGLWIVNLDVNSPQSIVRHVPELMNARQISQDECNSELYCGLPYFIPVITFIWFVVLVCKFVCINILNC